MNPRGITRSVVSSCRLITVSSPIRATSIPGSARAVTWPPLDPQPVFAPGEIRHQIVAEAFGEADQVGTSAPDRGVVTEAADQAVGTAPNLPTVVARAAPERVAGAGVERVERHCPPGDPTGVELTVAGDHVGVASSGVAPGDQLRAGGAGQDDHVVAVRAAQPVRAAVAGDAVVAALAEDVVRRRRSRRDRVTRDRDPP